MTSSPRSRLLRTAHELFQKNGYAAVSIRDIVTSVDLPKGTFYNYFRSKEELASVIVSQQSECLYEVHSDTTSRAPFGTLLRHLKFIGNSGEDSPLLLLSTLAIESPALPVQLRNQVCSALADWHKYVASLLAHAQGERVIAAGDSPEQLATLLVDMLLGATIWQKCQPGAKSLESYAEFALVRILSTANEFPS